MNKIKLLGSLFLLILLPIIGNCVFIIFWFLALFIAPFLKYESFNEVVKEFKKNIAGWK